MKKELEQITNLTINELLNKEIILPSLYFEKFNYHAKKMEIDLEDEPYTLTMSVSKSERKKI